MTSAKCMFLSFGSWWHGIGGIQQLLWSLALVSSFLSILFLLHYFSGLDKESSKMEQTRATRWTLLGFTVGSWVGVIASGFVNNALSQLILAVLAGLLAVGIRWLLFRQDLRKRSRFRLEQALKRTGHVLQSIPPNEAGIGTVHLHLRAAPFELKAVTMGEQIRPGQYIRVVEVMDEGVIKVEPIEEHPQGPGLPTQPTDRG